MKYAIEMTSDGMIYILSLTTVGIGIQKLFGLGGGGGMHAYTHAHMCEHTYTSSKVIS
jgi:hypothetical protein